MPPHLYKLSITIGIFATLMTHELVELKGSQKWDNYNAVQRSTAAVSPLKGLL